MSRWVLTLSVGLVAITLAARTDAQVTKGQGADSPKTPAKTEAPKNTQDTPAKQVNTVHGVIFNTPRVKFGTGVYIWTLCALGGNDQTASVTIGDVIDGASAAVPGLATVLAPYKLLGTLVNKAVTLKPGMAFCTYVKMSSDDVTTVPLLSASKRRPVPTNAYLLRYTAKGPALYTQTSNWLPWVRNDILWVRSITDPPDGQVIAASYCVDAVVDKVKRSLVVTFGDLDKVAKPADWSASSKSIGPATLLPAEAEPVEGKNCLDRGFKSRPELWR